METNSKGDLTNLHKGGSSKLTTIESAMSGVRAGSDLKESQPVLTALKSTLEILFGNLEKDEYSQLFDMQNNSKKSSGQVPKTNENVENTFNVQYGELSPKSVQHEKLRSCCCSKERISRKISYRLKKSESHEQGEDVNEDTFACPCNCLHRSNGRQIRNLLDDITKKKLKISARL